jgi:hypothetical protein
MVNDRTPLGLLITALGAATLALSVFLPWYGVSITAAGTASAQQTLTSVAQQYGNATLQATTSELGAEFGSIAGRQLTTVTAREALSHISAFLLLIAGIALLASLLRLADFSLPIEAGGGQIALAGVAAALCVLFRMLVRPGAQTDLISLSLSWGIWLALVGAAAMVCGGLLSTSSRNGHKHQARSFGLQS